MGQKKLIRFAAIKTFDNVLEYPENMPGKWGNFFSNQNSIILELACGRGEYTVGLSAMHPENNYIGVDVKGNRMFIGAKKCLQDGRKNAGFLRTQIERIDNYFGQNEVSEIWLTFPDPQLRFSRFKKRLTHPRFLRLYQKFLTPDGYIHLKTDSPVLYTFTKKVIELYQCTLVEDCDNVYAKSDAPELKIKTYYEGLDIAKSNTIFYLKFRLAAVLPESLDEMLKQEMQLIEKND